MIIMTKHLFFIPLLLILNFSSGGPYSAVIHLSVFATDFDPIIQSNGTNIVDILYLENSYITIMKHNQESHVGNIFVLEKRHLNGSLLSNVSFNFSSWTMDPAHEGSLANAKIVSSPVDEYYFVADVILVPANLSANVPDDPYYIDFNILIVKLNSSLVPQWSWVLGGYSMESVRDIEVDNNGNLYVFGLTTSYNFPTTANAFQTYPGNIDWRNREDFFLSKFTADGELSWSTFIGGTFPDLPIGMTLVNDTLFISGYTESSNFPIADGDQEWSDEWLYNLVISEFSLDGDLLHTHFVFEDTFLASHPNSWFSTGDIELLDDGSFVVAADVYVAGIEKYADVDNLYSYNISRSYPFNHEVPYLRMVVRLDSGFSPVWISGFMPVGEEDVYYNHMQDVVQINDSVAAIMYEPRYNVSYLALFDIDDGTIKRIGNSSSSILEVVDYGGSLYVIGNSGTIGFVGKLQEIPVPEMEFLTSQNSTKNETSTRSTNVINTTPGTEETGSLTADFVNPFLLTSAVLMLRKRKKG